MAGYGARVAQGATTWRVRAPAARALWLDLITADGVAQRHAMQAEGADWVLALPADHTGARYGYRAEGDWAPDRGLWFDPAKLLVDPWALELDTRFVQHPRLAEPGADTADIVPRARVLADLPDVPLQPPRFAPGGLIYEVNVRGFTIAHPAVPAPMRGTVAALAHPAVLEHLIGLCIDAIELMPIVAWIDERHLPPLGLANAWGYNPVAPLALDPRLCPGGWAELRDTVAVLHAAGIAVILDVVLNHTGESDVAGGVLCMRGLDDRYYAHDGEGRLINDTGCGNTLDFAYPPMRALALGALRAFVRHAGIDGFRFDLAPILARGPGFAADAPIFADIAADPWLADRVMIAEPWDIGPGGYQLGRFPGHWLEWNDRFRDDVRRFWRGEGSLGELATRLAGSADIFGEHSRSVNFLAAHDGFTLADLISYAGRHNHANGEDNRDGHGENFSWNCGAEGPSRDPAIRARRAAAARALLATLFASTGTILLTAGDEFGRTQQGNNNAYAQDNPIGWVDWTARDTALEDYTIALATWRRRQSGKLTCFPHDGAWLGLDGHPLIPADWGNPALVGLIWEPASPDQRGGFAVDRAGGIVRVG